MLVIKTDHCPEKLEVRDHMNLIIAVHECLRDRNHKGLHKSHLCVWATHKAVQSIVESEGKSL